MRRFSCPHVTTKAVGMTTFYAAFPTLFQLVSSTAFGADKKASLLPLKKHSHSDYFFQTGFCHRVSFSGDFPENLPVDKMYRLDANGVQCWAINSKKY